MNQIKHFIFLEIFYKYFSNFLNFCGIFILHSKDHGIFILMADEKMNRGVHPPQKIMKKIKKIIEIENIYTIGNIFFCFLNFFVDLVDLYLNFYFLIG